VKNMSVKTRNRVFGPLISVLAVIFGLVLVGPINPASASVEKVGVCHRTASETNPYVLITVPVDEANGHITGTDKQHNHKVYWNAAGTWDGMEHAAGAERMDYYASDGISGSCSNGEQPPPPETNDASFVASVTDATCEVGEVLTYSGSHVTFEGPASPVTGPATDVEVLATPEAEHGWATEGSGGTRTVFEGDLAGPLTGEPCAEVPGTETHTDSFSEDGCKVGGVHTWDVVYTTTFTWDESAGEYVGTEDEGVVQNESFTPYTESELETLSCVEVEGEQGHQHHGGNNNHPEVKGEQATVVPAAAAVPSEVEAGLAGTTPAGAPTGGSSLPLWALALGAGLFLTGAGRLRRATR
jgi:hypothetical protein